MLRCLQLLNWRKLFRYRVLFLCLILLFRHWDELLRWSPWWYFISWPVLTILFTLKLRLLWEYILHFLCLSGCASCLPSIYLHLWLPFLIFLHLSLSCRFVITSVSKFCESWIGLCQGPILCPDIFSYI